MIKDLFYNLVWSWGHNACNVLGRNSLAEPISFQFGFNSDLFFFMTGWHNNVKEHCLPYYLLIAWKRIVRFIPFPRLLVLHEIQTALFRIWTQVVELTYSVYNNHATNISINLYTYLITIKIHNNIKMNYHILNIDTRMNQ